MLYFKHYSNMRNDVKLRRVVSRYGLEGYGLYCLIVESITESLSEDSPIPDLQETCEDIACFYNGNASKINEMANFMINQGLFELDELSGAMLCHKVYKFLDVASTRSEKLKRMIRAYKESTSLTVSETSQTVPDNPEQSQTNPDQSQTNPDQSRTVTARREEKRRDKKSYNVQNAPSPISEKSKKELNEEEFEIWWKNYPRKENKKKAQTAYLRMKNLPSLEEHLKIVDSWKRTEKWTEDNGAYILHAATWLNGERWNDEIPLSSWQENPGKVSATAPAADHRTEWEDVGNEALGELLEAVGR